MPRNNVRETTSPEAEISYLFEVVWEILIIENGYLTATVGVLLALTFSVHRHSRRILADNFFKGCNKVVAKLLVDNTKETVRILERNFSVLSMSLLALMMIHAFNPDAANDPDTRQITAALKTVMMLFAFTMHWWGARKFVLRVLDIKKQDDK